ncbi:MAG: threonine synthase, partial [Hyphomicrobiales bacterium]|nr:threonine synthase [Hyphomicrobiales bacterium]
MQYISTRGSAPVLSFTDTLLAGLARDGGLYVPESLPQWTAAEIAALAGLPYAEAACRVMGPFVEGAFPAGDFATMAASAYGTFRHEAVTPLSQIGDNLFLLELFHGPTLA